LHGLRNHWALHYSIRSFIALAALPLWLSKIIEVTLLSII